SEKLKEDIQGYSLKAYNMLGASGVIRIDFMVDKNDDIYLEEVNNIPGSLAFYLWEKDGIDFSQLCDTLIKNAIAKYRDSEKKITSFDTNILEGYKK
ncbi:MAG: D-alanine--D-alanine ligase, partial [Erysipelotrichaceae bacterium]|nr:D-alanine--D-alanine ligase [Erysipelotrichaceae bacterium]